MMEDLKEFNLNFKTIREELGLEVEDISKELDGLSVSIIRNIESGRTEKFSAVSLYKKMQLLSGFTREELHGSIITPSAVRNRLKRMQAGYDDDEFVINITKAGLVQDFERLQAAVQVLLEEIAPLKAKILNLDISEVVRGIEEKREAYLKAPQQWL